MGNLPNSSSFQIFIISWKGTHENAKLIAESLSSFSENMTIVYSDPRTDFSLDVPCHLIRRPNELFWEDKFKACIDECDDSSMLVIHADCHCEDWNFLVTRCFEVNLKYPKVGVWSPLIEGTDFPLSCTKLLKIEGTDLNIVAITDGIIFSLSKDIVSRMKQAIYGENILGWGIGLLFCASSHLKGLLTLVDEAVTVIHPRSRGYNSQLALLGRSIFYKQFSVSERAQTNLLLGYVRFYKLRNKLNKDI